MNQHGQSAAVAPDVLWREFTGGVRAIGRTLLVLTLDASERGPLTRAWCVAEIAAGLQGDGTSGGGAAEGSFEVIMTPAEEARFLKELTDDFDTVVQRTCTVDLARCHAYHGDECLENGVCRDVAAGRVAACSDDLRFVLDNVRREMPLEEASKRVIQRMIGSMEGIARAALAAIPDANKRAGSRLQFYLARFLCGRGRLEEAEILLRETSEVCGRIRGAEAESTLLAIGQLATVLKDQGKFDEAEPLYREQLLAQRRTLGNAHRNTLTSISNLGLLLQARGNLGGAEELLREALDASRSTLGNAHPDTLTSITNLGSLLQIRGDLNGAEQLYRESLVAQRRTLGDAHPGTLNSISNLGLLLQDRGDLDGAELLYREALEARRRTLGDAHQSTLTSISNLGALLDSRGDKAGAELLYREALEARRRTLGDAHPSTLNSFSNLGALLFERGILGEAATLLRESLAGRRSVLGDVNANTRDTALWLSDTLCAQASAANLAAADAVLLLREALAAQRLGDGADSTGALKSARNLADLLVSLGDAASVSEAALLVDESLVGLRRNLGEAHASPLIAMRVRGRVLAAQGDLAGADAAFRASLDGLRALGKDVVDEVAKSARELAAVLRAKGDEAGAAEVEASLT